MLNLFNKLPFREAIEALRERLSLPKTAREAAAFGMRGGRQTTFLELDAANRSRAFTMAWISDQQLLENIHDELSVAINNGETYADFRKRLEELKERSGWTGTSAWHYRVVYDQNIGMAYSAGRVQQGQASGLSVWRYLPSVAADPRPEHEPYYNNLYRMAPGSPVPPIDFGCNCGWEWVFEDELDAPAESYPVFSPPVPKSGFVWSATDYFNLQAVVSGNLDCGFRIADCGLRAERLVSAAAVEAVPREVERWFELAVEAASNLGRAKFERALKWLQKLAGGDDGVNVLQAARQRMDDLLTELRDDDEAELNHQVTLAALLKGRVDVAEGRRRESGKVRR